MLLAIDIGNTNIVFGVNHNADWIKIWRIKTTAEKTSDEYEVLFRSLFTGANVTSGYITHVIISSVVPSLSRAFREMIRNFLSLEAMFVRPEIYSLLPLEILNPYEIGTDLVANATAAISKHPSPCLVIDFGTALTFTTVGQAGNILGVAIAPGLRTAVKALAGNTAQLPHVELAVPPSVLGKNTVHAIQSGIVLGYTGMVRYMIEQIQKEVPSNLRIIATGGLASVIAPYCQNIDCIEENLTLDGLKIISEYISGQRIK